MPSYECHKCGACCKYLLVEAELLDILREPRLLEADPHYRGRAMNDVLAELRDEFRVVIPSRADGCVFLSSDNTCSIYPTRPNACVAMEAGDEQCQEARRADGLPGNPCKSRASRSRGATTTRPSGTSARRSPGGSTSRALPTQ